jgi:Cu/Ag efflux pump CusA
MVEYIEQSPNPKFILYRNSFFTATSMIGFIALAGIIVRNSIIVVDFAENRFNNPFSTAYSPSLLRT